MKVIFKTYHKIYLVALSVLLASCATVNVNWQAEDPGPVPNYEAAKAQAKDAIGYLLKDPGSAQFRNFTPFFKMFYRYDGFGGGEEPLWTLCVEVNARNSFGGYTGYDWYVVKFRDGEAVRDKNGVFRAEFPIYCIEGPADPSRRAPG